MTHQNLFSRALPLGVAFAVATSACVTVEVPTLPIFEDAGAYEADAADASGPEWSPGVYPDDDAVVATDACTALSECCTADDAGQLYCGIELDCAEAFQRELDYGYCYEYTYEGFEVDGSVTP